MIAPEFKYWMWLVKGLNGIISIMISTIYSGSVPSEQFYKELLVERNRIDEILNHSVGRGGDGKS